MVERIRPTASQLYYKGIERMRAPNGFLYGEEVNLNRAIAKLRRVEKWGKKFFEESGADNRFLEHTIARLKQEIFVKAKEERNIRVMDELFPGSTTFFNKA